MKIQLSTIKLTSQGSGGVVSIREDPRVDINKAHCRNRFNVYDQKCVGGCCKQFQSAYQTSVEQGKMQKLKSIRGGSGRGNSSWMLSSSACHKIQMLLLSFTNLHVSFAGIKTLSHKSHFYVSEKPLAHCLATNW